MSSKKNEFKDAIKILEDSYFYYRAVMVATDDYDAQQNTEGLRTAMSILRNSSSKDIKSKKQSIQEAIDEVNKNGWGCDDLELFWDGEDFDLREKK